MKASRQMSAAGTSRVSVASFHSDPGEAAARGLGYSSFLYRSVREADGKQRHFLVPDRYDICRPTRTSSQMSSLAGSHPSIPQGFGFKSRGAHHMSR